jgi:hypothetical protein
MVLYQICVFGADLKSNMAARVHNVFSLAASYKRYRNEKVFDKVYIKVNYSNFKLKFNCLIKI